MPTEKINYFEIVGMKVSGQGISESQMIHPERKIYDLMKDIQDIDLLLGFAVDKYAKKTVNWFTLTYLIKNPSLEIAKLDELPKPLLEAYMAVSLAFGQISFLGLSEQHNIPHFINDDYKKSTRLFDLNVDEIPTNQVAVDKGKNWQTLLDRKENLIKLLESVVAKLSVLVTWFEKNREEIAQGNFDYLKGSEERFTLTEGKVRKAHLSADILLEQLQEFRSMNLTYSRQVT